MLQPDFFAGNTYFVDEKVAVFSMNNRYKVYNENGEQLGNITSNWGRGIFPFRVEVRDMNDQLLVTLKRGWTFINSKITILDANNMVLGIIKQKFRVMFAEFLLCDEAGNPFAHTRSDFGAWNFPVTDNQQKSIGLITKKWAGMAKEFFTTADKYIVAIDNPKATKEEKLTLLSLAIAVDMVLKEKK